MGDTLSRDAIRVRPRHEKRMNYLLELREIVFLRPLFSTRRKWAERRQAFAVAVVSRLHLPLVRRQRAGVGVAYTRSDRGSQSRNHARLNLSRGHSALKHLDASSCKSLEDL